MEITPTQKAKFEIYRNPKAREIDEGEVGEPELRRCRDR